MKAAVSERRERLQARLQGAVQGVGFRPFVFRLANEMGLYGWVLNSAQGVFLEVEGGKPALEEFLLRLQQEKPPQARIWSLEFSFLQPVGYAGFEIRHSDTAGEKTVTILPEIATCPDCLREILDSGGRHFSYPFTNCTNCGPRFSIIRELPYDRGNTSMAAFPMCEECRKEYENPRDRRFHAQPTACPKCGPSVELWDESGKALAHGAEALQQAAQTIREGKILALKGLGGFLLLVDARSEEAVQRLRQRKLREEKPFAVLFPFGNEGEKHGELSVHSCELRVGVLHESALAPFPPPLRGRIKVAGEITLTLPSPIKGEGIADNTPLPTTLNSQLSTLNCLAEVARHCHVSALEARLLLSPESPIVLLRKKAECALAEAVAPGNPNLGAMLPYSPLHHLLMRELGFPVVATSGNRTDEPIVIDENEARTRLKGIADFFLVHNRPIVRHCDDSVVRVMLGREMVLRRARGYAPLPVYVKKPLPAILAVGAHLKNTVAISAGEKVIISQHIGDLETPQAYRAFFAAVEDLQKLYDLAPKIVACDLHPDYLSTRYAQTLGLPMVAVQHHHAHLASCMAENQLDGETLGICWDGTGYGPDGTLWGGEFLVGDYAGFRRAAHFLPVALPGGEEAIREPRRIAFSILWDLFGEKAREREDLAPVRSLSPTKRTLFAQMLGRKVSSPGSCGVGRLFDAVASLLDIRQKVSFEGQAAMELEYVADEQEGSAYPFELVDTPAASDARATEVTARLKFPPPLRGRNKVGGHPHPTLATLRSSEWFATSLRSTSPHQGGGEAADHPIAATIAENRIPQSSQSDSSMVLDWRPMILAVLEELKKGTAKETIAARFHNTLIEAACRVAEMLEVPQVALSGGVFQNRLLTEGIFHRLTEKGFVVHVHQRVPPNDGGISLGQIMVAADLQKRENN